MKRFKKREYGEPKRLKEVYMTLSPSAFSALIVLANEKKQEFKRYEIIDILNFSKAQTNRILRELKICGFIKIENEGSGKRSLIKFKHKILFNKNHKLIIL